MKRGSVVILGFQPHFGLILYVIFGGLTLSLSLSLLAFTMEPNISARSVVRMKWFEMWEVISKPQVSNEAHMTVKLSHKIDNHFTDLTCL